MRAETHGAIKSTGIGWKIRCALTQASGIQLRRRWEDDASRRIRHKWITECKSLFDYLTNAIAAGCEDKRLEIDLERLRQDIWEFPDGTPKDFKEEDERDRCIWIDTTVMLADCLTKWSKSKVDKTNKQKFIQFLQDGILNFEQDAEAKMQKYIKVHNAGRRKIRRMPPVGTLTLKYLILARIDSIDSAACATQPLRR